MRIDEARERIGVLQFDTRRPERRRALGTNTLDGIVLNDESGVTNVPVST